MHATHAQEVMQSSTYAGHACMPQTHDALCFLSLIWRVMDPSSITHSLPGPSSAAAPNTPDTRGLPRAASTGEWASSCWPCSQTHEGSGAWCWGHMAESVTLCLADEGPYTKQYGQPRFLIMLPHWWTSLGQAPLIPLPPSLVAPPPSPSYPP